jgi:hypothetical protein
MSTAYRTLYNSKLNDNCPIIQLILKSIPFTNPEAIHTVGGLTAGISAVIKNGKISLPLRGNFEMKTNTNPAIIIKSIPSSESFRVSQIKNEFIGSVGGPKILSAFVFNSQEAQTGILIVVGFRDDTEELLRRVLIPDAPSNRISTVDKIVWGLSKFREDYELMDAVDSVKGAATVQRIQTMLAVAWRGGHRLPSHPFDQEVEFDVGVVTVIVAKVGSPYIGISVYKKIKNEVNYDFPASRVSILKTESEDEMFLIVVGSGDAPLVAARDFTRRILRIMDSW